MSAIHSEEEQRTSFERDPAEIEREIEHTREELDRTLEALQAKLSPRRQLEQALTHARASSRRVTHSAVEMMKRNPVPFAIVGATLLVALIAASRGRRS
jgi:chromosome segregation ATPase